MFFLLYGDQIGENADFIVFPNNRAILTNTGGLNRKYKAPDAQDIETLTEIQSHNNFNPMQQCLRFQLLLFFSLQYLALNEIPLKPLKSYKASGS